MKSSLIAIYTILMFVAFGCNKFSLNTLLSENIGMAECGASANSALFNEPNQNLCKSGSASNIQGSGPWSWSCSSVDQKNVATCSAQVSTATVDLDTELTSLKLTDANRNSFPISGNCGLDGTQIKIKVASIEAEATCEDGRFLQEINLSTVADNMVSASAEILDVAGGKVLSPDRTVSREIAVATSGAPGSDWYTWLKGEPISPATITAGDYSKSFFSNDPHRRMSVTVKMPVMTGAVIVDLSTYLSNTDGYLNYLMINCALFSHSTHSRDYGNTTTNPCVQTQLPTLIKDYLTSRSIDPAKPLELILSTDASRNIPIDPGVTANSQGHIFVGNQSDVLIRGGGSYYNMRDGTVAGVHVRSSFGYATDRVRVIGMRIFQGPPSGYRARVINYSTDGGATFFKALEVENALDPRWIFTEGGEDSVLLKNISAAHSDPALRDRQFFLGTGKASTVGDDSYMRLDRTNPAKPILIFKDQTEQGFVNMNSRFAVSDTVVVRIARGASAILGTGEKANDFSLEDIDVLNANNTAFLFSFFGRGMHLNRCRLMYADSNAVSTTPGAGVRTTSTRGDLVITNSLFEGVGDDGIVLTGAAKTLFPNGVKTNFTLANGTEELTITGAANLYAINETVVFYNSTATELRPLSVYRIATISGSTVTATKIYGTTGPINNAHTYIVFTRERNSGRYYVADSIVRNSPVNGSAISAPNGLIENNSITDISGRGLQFSMMAYLSEGVPFVGAFTYNLTIRDNLLRNVANGFGHNNSGHFDEISGIVFRTFDLHQTTTTSFPQFSNIWITRNRIENAGWFGVYLNLGADINILGNHVDSCRGQYTTAICTTAVAVNSSTGVAATTRVANKALNVSSGTITF